MGEFGGFLISLSRGGGGGDRGACGGAGGGGEVCAVAQASVRWRRRRRRSGKRTTSDAVRCVDADVVPCVVDAVMTPSGGELRSNCPKRRGLE